LKSFWSEGAPGIGAWAGSGAKTSTGSARCAESPTHLPMTDKNVCPTRRSLSNYIPPEFRGPTPAGTRNTLALVNSPDLRNWRVVATILQHKDRAKHGFQYVDWLFDRKDIIAASRTAYDDGEGGAHSAHDANYLTFHRISDFRSMGGGK
jgi:hypothetical protein